MKKFLNMLKGKSKTVNFNALIAAIFGICSATGHDVNPQVIIGVQTVGNIVLRSITTTSMDDK